VTIVVTVTRERDEPRFRAKLHSEPGGHAFFITAQKLGSVTLAKKEAQKLLGDLDWQDPGPTFSGDVRAVAYLELE
jgi:hypothetical protein